MSHPSTRMGIHLSPGFAAGMPEDQTAWAHHELSTLAEDHATRNRSAFSVRDFLWRDQVQCNRLYSSVSGYGGIDAIRVPVQHEAPLSLLADIDAPLYPRLALAGHRVAEALRNVQDCADGPSVTYQGTWARRMASKYHGGHIRLKGRDEKCLVVACHGLTVAVAGGYCTVRTGQPFSVSRGKRINSVTGAFNRMQLRNLRALFAAWMRLRREWIASRCVSVLVGYHYRPGDAIQMAFVPGHACYRGVPPVDGYVLQEGKHPVSERVLVVDTTEVERGDAYRAAGYFSRHRRQDVIETVDDGFLASLPTVRPLRADWPTIAETLATMDDTAKDFIQAIDEAGNPVDLASSRAKRFTVYRDRSTGPEALTTTKWLETAVDIERSNRIDVPVHWSLRLDTAAAA